MNLAERYTTAAKCYLSEAWKSRKLTSFGSMSIAAVEYVHESIGKGTLSNRQRENIQDAIDLGVVINDYRDEHYLARYTYKQIRRAVRNNNENKLSTDYRRYFQDIKQIEKNRPDPSISSTERVFEYRERLNAVALAGVCAMAELGKYGDLVGENKYPRPETEKWFGDLWRIIMALQVIDDQVGWIGDLRHNRPSFYTGLAIGSGLPREEINPILRTKRSEYLIDVGKDNTSVKMEPLVAAVGMIGMVMPVTYEMLRKIPGGNRFMKGRERKEG